MIVLIILGVLYGVLVIALLILGFLQNNKNKAFQKQVSLFNNKYMQPYQEIIHNRKSIPLKMNNKEETCYLHSKDLRIIFLSAKENKRFRNDFPYKKEQNNQEYNLKYLSNHRKLWPVHYGSDIVICDVYITNKHLILKLENKFQNIAWQQITETGPTILNLKQGYKTGQVIWEKNKILFLIEEINPQTSVLINYFWRASTSTINKKNS